MSKPDQLVHIGTITSAHGVRGQVKILTFNDDPAQIASYKNITDAAAKASFRLKAQGRKDRFLIASIEGITDRNQAELLKGKELYTPLSSLPEKPENTWYHSELIGLAARLENGSDYGKIIAVHNFGAGDIIEIEKPDGSQEMLPFNDNFTGDIDAKTKSLLVFPPDYIEDEAP